MMNSLVHQVTGNSEGLDAHTGINKISAVEISDDILQMIGVPKIVIVENGNEVALGQLDPAIQRRRT